MAERIRLFANGFEFDCWDEKNCSRCVKASRDSESSSCDLFDAIGDAMWGDGTFHPKIVQRFGWKDEYIGVLGWPCAEFQAEGPIEPTPAAHEMAKAGAAQLPGFADPSCGQLAEAPS